MNRTDTFLKLLVDDSTYRNIELPDDENEKKQLVRSLMNVRMPRTISEDMLKAQDEYLDSELLAKKITDVSDIKTVKEQYGSTISCADRISVWQGDITSLSIDAIVNAANSGLLGCFVPCHRCIDNAIHSAAGMQLREECNHIMNRRRIKYGNDYEEGVGTATLTNAYKLPCRYVIHTVGPIVYGKLNEGHCKKLADCYRSCLTLAADKGLKSIAFCCISTGEFHFPEREAAKIAVETVTDFLQKNETIERVVFDVFKQRDCEIYEELLK